ncbi:MAG: hypothetical protein KAJ07_00310 [Planctomycetes bacterium]|nr:hypothetical protein [Planctomycetota bacterium]
MAFDSDEIKALRPLVDVISERVQLKKDGKEYRGLCPFHSEKTPSFTVIPEKEFFHCFGCGANGDVLDFIMEADAVDFKGACEILGGKRKAGKKIAGKKAVKKIIKSCYDGIEPVAPVPSNAPLFTKGKSTPPIWNPKRDEAGKWRESTYTPEMVFGYLTKEGQLYGYVLRVVIAGKKLTPSIMWCKRKNKAGEEIEGWCHFPFPEPRPLYGLERLDQNPDAPVLIVEGEKCVDAAHRLLPTYNVLSWPGGTKAFSKADWGPLRDKKVLIWPDADEPGVDTMALVASKMLDVSAASVKLIGWDKDKPKGWDVADAEADKWTKEKVIAWAKGLVAPYPPVEAAGAPSEDGSPPIDTYNTEEIPDMAPLEDEYARPFRALGHRNNVFFYMPKATQQIVALTPQQHAKNNFLLLAPLSFWEGGFPAKSKDGINWDAAYESLLKLQAKVGIFDAHKQIRGRGAWIDAGRTVLHLGTKVYVDGAPFEPQDVDSKHTYPRDIDLDIDTSKIASTKEAQLLVSICRRLSWKHPLSGHLLAGWLVIAPVCGMLKWRPHLWVTGASGLGKSTIIDTIVKKTIGATGQVFSKDTTEAAIRQHLGQDALPIVIDEFEAEDKKAIARVQGILGLARVASSGGYIFKGTADGSGQGFSMRSCFLFGSINTSIYQAADENRISKLILQQNRAPNADEEWQVLHGDIVRTFTAEYANKMLARSLANLKILQANCNMFIEAAARVLKSRRIADQIGSLLAGSHLCFSLKEIGLDEAVTWIEKQDWTEHTTIESKTDEERLLDRLATSRVRFDSSAGPKNTSVGHLITIAAYGAVEGEGITVVDAQRELKLYGIKVENVGSEINRECYVLISNVSDPIKGLLANTPWVGEWGRPLRDLKGAEATDTIHFSPGIKSRATKIPVELFL